MPRLKLTLEYDGTAYVGWQVQPNGPSIQGVVEAALAKLHGHVTPVLAAARTDSGVHAVDQVIAFDTPHEFPLKAYWRGLSQMLPPDIAVTNAEAVPAGFEPRRWASTKIYVYRVANRRVRSPLRRLTHWELFTPLDVDAMEEAAGFLRGSHDFSAFRAADCQCLHARRTLFRVDVRRENADEVAIWVEGNAFLKHMVRNVVGTLIFVGRHKRAASWVKSVLDSRDRTQAGPTAPAHGLTLMKVNYGDRSLTGNKPADDAALTGGEASPDED